jgi:predicted TIM-barrel fold metal-dependent hydrolase
MVAAVLVDDGTFAAAERHDMPVFLYITGALPFAEPIVRRYPNLRIVIDHMGLPQPHVAVRDDAPFGRLDELLGLAQYANVFVKLSGAPALSLAGYPYDDVWPFLHQILDKFSVERVFWASDISASRVASAGTGGWRCRTTVSTRKSCERACRRSAWRLSLAAPATA